MKIRLFKTPKVGADVSPGYMPRPIRENALKAALENKSPKPIYEKGPGRVCEKCQQDIPEDLFLCPCQRKAKKSRRIFRYLLMICAILLVWGLGAYLITKLLF